MCGLTELLISTPNDDIIGQVAGTPPRLIHRGSDDEGDWAEGAIGLDHRRLAILDVNVTAAQPMPLDFNRYVLAYNGKVYNRLNLRNALKMEGTASLGRGQRA
ncbi:hypothetical protein [Sulfitobacter sp. M22]|uniref:hypothetical protein n=1 Tax=Sulfitobacter sp. M22 TaxID=2675332 RepID=UPI003FCCCB5B